VDHILKVILNVAASIDGKISTITGDTKISSNQDLLRVHQLRSKVDAIVIGINTVINDDPMLTERLTQIRKNLKLRGANITDLKKDNTAKIRSKNSKNPIRVIIDSRARIPLKSKIVKTADQVETIIAVTNDAPKSKLKELSKQGLKITVIDKDSKTKEKVDLKKLLKVLENESISTILVEGGGEVNWSFIENNIFDELIITIAPIIIGGKDATTLVDGKGYEVIKKSPKLVLMKMQKKNTGEITLYYKNPNRGKKK
jgi:2,5-diamino-6-(ribosylamino)-4(3H)-pyrimidinone 5'-phosphate reductase